MSSPAPTATGTVDVAPAILPRPMQSPEEQMQVTVEEVVFRSNDGRFSVISATRDGRADADLTLVGDLSTAGPGETLHIRGRFTEHPTYGKRFVVDSFLPVTPTTVTGMRRYLGSGLVPGVGPALAERLVATFGERTLQVITTQSGRLREVDGIGARRADAIAQAVRTKKDEAEVFALLQGLGLGPALSRRVRERFGADTVRVVREDPYLVAAEVSGVGFRTADRIGLGQGYTQDDPRRAAGAALHLLHTATEEGHTYLTLDQLHVQGETLDVPKAALDDALATLEGRGLLVREGDAYYPPPLARAERRVCARLLSQRRELGLETRVEETVRREAGKHYAKAQVEAVVASLKQGLLVLTGGPGTGKTTTVKAIVAAHRALDHRVALCAPTGRAAKRLAEATGHDAQTIHRLLEYNPATHYFARNRNEPLETDLLLVDETSMLDVQLADRLLDALPPSASLVLVGDADQLPPISPGPLLRDILESGACPVVRLTEIFRQAQQSAIVTAAHEILRGHPPVPTRAGPQGVGDLFVVKAVEPDAVATRLRALLDRMRTVYGLDPVRDVQILTPMRRGPLGTERLNRVLQEHLNGAGAARPGSGQTGFFRPGDKIMQLRNDYERDVFNGDLGEVRKVDAGVVFAQVGGRSVAYERDAQDAISLAYASTIHKVQGSEFPAVIIVLHAGHHVLLTRPLLYTAVTRAKRLAVILGDPRALRRALQNADQGKTNSGLARRLVTAERSERTP